MFINLVSASEFDAVDDEDVVDEDVVDEDVDDFSKESSNACRVLATVSWELLPPTWAVADVEPLGGPDAILSWMLVKILWASDRLPDCKALDRLCRSLLSGSLLEPPFCDETSFCSALNAVSAVDTLPDWSAVASVLKSCAKVLVLVEVEVEDVEPGACGADANLSWMLVKILWASDRLPDCKALDRLCRSLLKGSLLEPPFCEETSFCSADSVVWASVVLPDCRSLLRVAIKLEMLEEVLLEEELSPDEGGGGGPCDCISCPSMDNPAEESICAKISSMLELLWEVLEEEVVDEDVLDVVVPADNSLFSSAINSFISLSVDAFELPVIPLIELVIS
jgi:hypothetical protein